MDCLYVLNINESMTVEVLDWVTNDWISWFEFCIWFKPIVMGIWKLEWRVESPWCLDFFCGCFICFWNLNFFIYHRFLFDFTKPSLFYLVFLCLFLFWEEKDIKYEQKYTFTPVFNWGELQKTSGTYLRCKVTLFKSRVGKVISCQTTGGFNIITPLFNLITIL